ncbi:MAG: Mur ligase family protein, partial [Bacteroidota bacterium]
VRPLADYPDAALRIFDRPPLPSPDALDDVYLIGICGKGMGALAELLREAGYAVRGSDAAAYPPMSTRLERLGIRVLEGYDPGHLAPTSERGAPSLTVVGNACTPTHPEAAYAREQGLVQTSLPGALAHVFLQQRRSLVVAGTHGKTTTTGLLAHVLREAGRAPSFLVGGVMAGLDRTCAVGSGPHFVIEGDEYDSAYFDKRPKMLLYQPTGAIVTSLEFDHADIYDDWDDYRAAFEAFAMLVGTYGSPVTGRPGTLVLNGDDPHVRALADHTTAAVRTFGLDASNDVTAQNARAGEGGQRFDLVVDSATVAEVFLPMSGAHNRMNALAVAALALAEGLSPDEVAAGLATFRGMQRRQEVKGQPGGVLVVDDFAHHPTAVAKTLDAVRERWAARRLVAVFEPRSNSSRRKLFEARYAESFDAADAVFLKTPPLRHNDDPADFLDPQAVAAEITRRGTPAAAYESVDALLPDLLAELRPGDLALVMSNGSFDGLMGRLLAALDE